MISLDSLLSDASSFIKSEFNLELQKSQLKPYSPDNWQQFCSINDFDINSDGLYVPASYSAYVNAASPLLALNIFHEFYGHGLFCEHSQIGQRLVNLIHNNGDERSFLFNEADPQGQALGLCRTNIANYEGFAVWLEALLCEETNNDSVWQLKKDALPVDHIHLFEYFQSAEYTLSRFGLLAQLGFPKYYDECKILNVIKKMYGSAFNNIEFVVLYGSQRPESDIDLFVVSKNPSINYFNGWLDVYELNRAEFIELANNLDISITDPLFTGILIYGDKNCFEGLKHNITAQPITQEAISHNFVEAERQKQYVRQLPETHKRRKDCLSYIDSYSQNAEQLSLGNKPLTLANLKKIYAG